MNHGTFRGGPAVLSDYPLLPNQGSWGGNRGRFNADEFRMFGVQDGQRNWLGAAIGGAGGARLLNTNPGIGTNATFPGDSGMVFNVGSGTLLLNGVSFPWIAGVNFSGRYRQTTGGTDTACFEVNVISDNVPGKALQLSGFTGLTSTTFYIANGAACTVTSPAQTDIVSGPYCGTFNSGTLTGSVTNYQANFTVGSGATITTRKCYEVADSVAGGALAGLVTGGAGAVTNQYGFDVPILTFASTLNTAIRIGQGGQTLTVAVPSNGEIDVFTGTTTLNFANCVLPPVINMGGTLSLSQSAQALGMLACFSVHPTIVNTLGSTVSFGPVIGLSFAPTFTANTQTVASIGTQIGMNFGPVTSIASGGTISAGTLIGLQVGANVGASTTITTYQGVNVTAPTIGGTLSTWVGVDIAQVTGAGTNIGIRNASPTSFTPSTNQTLAAATTVAPNATHIQVIQTSGANITLTATPTITAGSSGQFLVIENVSSVAGSTFTFQSNTSLAGSNLSLGAATRVVGLKGSLTLIYNTALTRWVEVGFNGGGNG